MISIGLVAYGLSFVVGLVLGQAFGIDVLDTTSGEVSLALWYAAMASAGLIMYLSVKWYFLDLEVHPSLREGFRMGGVILGIGFLLDSVLILLASMGGGGSELISFYLSPLFLLTVLFSLCVSGLVGFEEAYRRAHVREEKEVRKKKKNKKKKKGKR